MSPSRSEGGLGARGRTLTARFDGDRYLYHFETEAGVVLIAAGSSEEKPFQPDDVVYVTVSETRLAQR